GRRRLQHRQGLGRLVELKVERAHQGELRLGGGRIGRERLEPGQGAGLVAAPGLGEDLLGERLQRRGGRLRRGFGRRCGGLGGRRLGGRRERQRESQQDEDLS